MPLPDGDEAAEFDRKAIREQGVPAPVLMENAGRGAAGVLARLWPRGPVVVVAGSGNNGGDGLVLARTLMAQGREVTLLPVGSRTFPDPLLHGWSVPVVPPPDDDAALLALLEGAAVLVDGLLGTGAKGAPRGAVKRLIRAMNDSGRPILALDLPSGVDANTGATPGASVLADTTVSFGAPKLGTLRFPGRIRAGRLIVVEIGFPPMGEGDARSALITASWARSQRPVRSVVGHKKSSGWVLVLAGSRGMAGAAVLAARGALRAGAGYVQVASVAANREILQEAVPEAIFLDLSDHAALADSAEACDTLVAGPGLGRSEETGEALDAVLAASGKGGIVLDADALHHLGEGRLPSFAEASSPDRRLLTPHPGEMVQLGGERDAILEDPLESARRGAERWSSTLLLKGSPSVVAAPGGSPVLVASSGSSDLARAGMGDVLGGVAGAFLARGCSAGVAAGLALHFTGRAAAISGKRESLLPSDVAESLSEALTEPLPGVSGLDLPWVTLDLEPAR